MQHEAFRRSAADVKVAGVCGGVAARWGIDPVLVRVGTAVLALSGGLGLVLYLAGWLLVPVRGEEQSIVESAFPQAARWPREAWIAVTVIAGVLAFSVLGPLTPFGFGPAVILAVLWYVGSRRAGRPGPRGRWSTPAPPPVQRPVPPQQQAPLFVRYPGPATPFTEAAEAWQRRLAEHYTGHAAPNAAPDAGPSAVPTAAPTAAHDAGPSEPTWPQLSDAERGRAAFLADPDPVGLYTEPVPLTARDQRLQRARSLSARRLRLATLAVLGLALSGLAAADALGAVVPLSAYLATGLLVLGLALVAAAWWGRARGLLGLAGLLLIGTLVATAVPGAAADMGSLTHRTTLSYTSLDALPAADHRDAGDLTVDLSRLTVSRSATYEVDLTMGRMTVKLPKDANVRLSWTVRGGAMSDSGSTAGGNDLSGLVTTAATRTGAPTLVIRTDVGVGQLRVVR